MNVDEFHSYWVVKTLISLSYTIPILLCHQYTNQLHVWRLHTWKLHVPLSISRYVHTILNINLAFLEL